MNTTALSFAVTLAAASALSAGTVATDDFDDEVINPDIWTLNSPFGVDVGGLPSNDNIGKIFENSNQLQYTDPFGIFGTNLQYLTLEQVLPSDRDWTASVLLSNTHTIGFEFGLLAIGMEIYNTGDPNVDTAPALSDYFNARLQAFDLGDAPGVQPFLGAFAELFVDGISTSVAPINGPPTSGILVVAFDAETQVLSATYDGTLLDAVSIAPWAMTPGVDFFSLNLYGASNVPTLAGEAFFDDFSAETLGDPATPVPTAVQSLQVSFETEVGFSYQIQASATGAPGSFVDVGDPVAGTGEPFSAAFPIDADRQFYQVTVQ